MLALLRGPLERPLREQGSALRWLVGSTSTDRHLCSGHTAPYRPAKWAWSYGPSPTPGPLLLPSGRGGDLFQRAGCHHPALGPETFQSHHAWASIVWGSTGTRWGRRLRSLQGAREPSDEGCLPRGEQGASCPPGCL